MPPVTTTAPPAPVPAIDPVTFDCRDAITRVREIDADHDPDPITRATPLLDEMLELAGLARVLAGHAGRLLAENEVLRRQVQQPQARGIS